MNLTGLIKETKHQRHVNYLRHAYHIAWLHSEDPATKTGAAIIDETAGAILVADANYYPPGRDPTPEQKADRNYKLKNIFHAEKNCIIAAARLGAGTNNQTMYMPWIPCEPCAALMAAAGIKRFVGHKAMIDKTPDDWGISTYQGLALLRREGIEALMYVGEIGGVDALFRKEHWRP